MIYLSFMQLNCFMKVKSGLAWRETGYVCAEEKAANRVNQNQALFVYMGAKAPPYPATSTRFKIWVKSA
ncbi:hypothetical protein GCM10011396_50150 [Undibacterium terreum]|uniref:Uncharacterized protein n=1 Tax=Undibacterium terreum TaxID=1224302 RepID=A0A916V019_9BURK|nr:hypothetical protein GCM10011396_50150 [Undibacterium terreum]